MVTLNMKYLEDLQQYLESGELEEDFKWSAEERRLEILEFLEKLMDVGEAADGAASKIIFKGQLGAMFGGAPVQKEAGEAGRDA